MSKVATYDDNIKYPVHLPSVAEVAVDELKSLMNEKTLARFKELWRITTEFDPRDVAVKNPMKCTVADARQAVTNGLAVALPAGTPVTCHSFAVLEEKLNPPMIRRRPINWAILFNLMCDEQGYKADVNLRHHSAYFDRVNSTCGATFDLKAGFFQVGLPSAHLFTYMDEDGNIYGLKRLPMGICTAPEIMQIITSTLAGDRLLVKNEYRSLAVVDVWIDNILFSGSADNVAASIASFKALVKKVNATINTNDSTEGSDILNFIGMKYNFKDHTIDLAPKNRAKIDAIAINDFMPIQELESATARLMYASSILAVPLSRYYFALKFLRRRLSDLNRNILTRSDTVELPQSVKKSFSSWKNDISFAKARKLPDYSGRRRYTLWTDASMVGWAGVLINEITQQAQIVAGKWPLPCDTHINVLEAQAVVNSISQLRDLPNSVVQPKIDNTTVVSTVGKGYSHSEQVNKKVLEIQEISKRLNILLLRPVYVASIENIADHWSRHFPTSDQAGVRANGFG